MSGDIDKSKHIQEDRENVSTGKVHTTCSFILTVTGAVLGSFAFGYGVAVMNNPEQSIKDFMNQTQVDRTGSGLSEDAIKNLWSLAVSICPVGGCIGGFFGATLAKRFGRKRGSILNSLFGSLCAVLLFASKRAATYELLIVGRFLLGINCGIYTAISPLYLSEISATHIRGAVGVLHQLAIVTGILISQILGFHIILGDSNLWDVLVGLSIVPCLGQLIILPFCPASPRYLMMSKGDEEGSRKALIALRGSKDVEKEIDEMKQEMMSQEKKVSIVQLFLRPSLRTPIIIGIVMQCSQQLSGINGVFFYSTSLFQEIGLTQTTATYTTSAVGCIMVTMTLVSVPLMDRAGRRTLHLVGLGGMVIVGILVTLVLNLRHLAEAFKYVAVIVTLCYVVFFAIGPGSIPWLIVAELFSHESRPAAMSVCVLVNWLCSFIIGYIFPFVQDGLRDYTFLPFAMLLAIFFIFTYFKVPETKGKTFEEVTSLWKDEDKNFDNLEGNSNLGKEDPSSIQVKFDKNYGSTNKAYDSKNDTK